jgi:3-hydroxybutyryl-CoA dehydrogenase
MSITPTTVAVLGAGIMGRGIARVFAAAGVDVQVRDIDDAAIERGREALGRDLERTVARGHLDGGHRDALLGRISWTTSLVDAVGRADLVIEAAPENLELKRSIFTEIDRLTQPEAILATNTSALSITSIASVVARPERVVGLHFFNPVHRMELVEVVVGTATASTTVERALGACEVIGKVTIEVADRPGFATSRVNAMIGNEAFTMLMEGVASAEDIDTGMKLALNHPMGPFELVDLVGLDTRLSVLRRLHEGVGERFRPSPLLVSLVEAGRLGRKTGHGVYRYDDAGNRIPGSATIGDRPGGGV